MSEKIDLATDRREFRFGTLRRSELAEDPVTQFEAWLKQAKEHDVKDITAMVLATVDARGMPFQRTVLLKGLDERGFVFFTNLGSRKAGHIEANNQVSLLFPWVSIDRQVIVTGRAEPLGKMENMKYFLSRPRESQLAAWASHQSHPITARRVLEEKFRELSSKFSEGDIETPKFWGGYRIKPESVEFWQGGAHRLHDRFLYTRGDNDEWSVERLSP